MKNSSPEITPEQLQYQLDRKLLLLNTTYAMVEFNPNIDESEIWVQKLVSGSADFLNDRLSWFCTYEFSEILIIGTSRKEHHTLSEPKSSFLRNSSKYKLISQHEYNILKQSINILKFK